MESETTVVVEVGTNTYTIPVKLLEKYPNSVIHCAYTFNKKPAKLDFTYKDAIYFDTVVGIYVHDRVKIPPGLNTYRDLKEYLIFWGFDIEHPVTQIACDLKLIRNTKLQWPWGVWASSSDNVRWVPIVCNFLSLMLSSRCILNTAALGYKNVQLYVKHGVKYDKIGISLILSRINFLQKLAELNSCYIETLDGVYGYDVTPNSRVQDVVCNNQIHVHEWKYITHSTFCADCRRKGGDFIELNINGTFTMETKIKGFTVNITISDSQLFWTIISENDTTEPILVDDSRGFLIRVSLILGKTLLKHFLIPACDWISQPLKIKLSETTTYITDNDNWFSVTPFPQTVKWYSSPIFLPHHTISCVLYEATNMELDMLPVHHHENSIDESSFYERIELSW